MRDHMDPVLGQELERVFDDLASKPRAARGMRLGPKAPEPRRRAALVTAIVAVVVVIAAALTIQTVQSREAPAVGPTSRADDSSLRAALPTQQYGRVLHTWTEHDPTNPTGPFDASGSTVVIAAVCTGGGSISIKAPNRPAHKLGCKNLTVQQPFWKFNIGGDLLPTMETAPVNVTVSVLTGTPRYIVRMWAVDPRILNSNSWSIATTSATVPKSLRTCTADDIAPTGTVDPIPGRQRGVVTISSGGTTDCAIRSWPTMQYLGTDGSDIGPIQGEDENGKSLDSSEGSLNKYGEFPPALLAAGGDAYLIIDLYTRSSLEQDDADTKAREATEAPSVSMPPIPLCDPQTVQAVRLGIADATITVPAPSAPATGACTSDNRVFGVNPVVTERPTGEG